MTGQPTLASELDAVTAQVPKEIGDRVGSAVDEVARSGTASGLAVGDRAPSFELPDARGREVSLAERLTSGPVVLVFYRGEWCPYCNLQVRALQAALPEIRERGASLVAISPQSSDHSLSLAEKAELEFDVLSDVDQRVIRDYRVQFTAPADLQAVHLEVFDVDLREHNADGSWRLPVPATFIIDQSGTIVTADVEADYRKRIEPSEIIAALDAASAEAHT